MSQRLIEYCSNPSTRSQAISWRLTVDLDDQKQLFYGKEKLGYKVDAYLCECGHLEVVIRKKNQKTRYCCPECNNGYFYDANMAWMDLGIYLQKHQSLELPFRFQFFKDQDGMGISYVSSIPVAVDMVRHTLQFENIPVCSLYLTYGGKIREENAEFCNWRVRNEMKRRLERLIGIYRCIDMPYENGKKTTLGRVSFFLQHTIFKSAEFYLWRDFEYVLGSVKEPLDIKSALMLCSHSRKEKSVKKAVYQFYHRHMEDHFLFEPFYIYVMTQRIQDPNLLVGFLDYELFEVLNLEWDREDLDAFILFLKQYYTEKQIFRLFQLTSFSEKNIRIFYDTMNMYMTSELRIVRYFEKTRCTIGAIHDMFVKCQYLNSYDEKYLSFFQYTPQQLNRCVQVDSYRVALPDSNKTLFIWGNMMHNCIFGYEEEILQGKSEIYGFFTGAELRFVVEIQYSNIIEARSKYNEPLTKVEQKVLDNWFNKFFSQSASNMNMDTVCP